jgi:tetratricopeptide (TPR) repeat protein
MQSSNRFTFRMLHAIALASSLLAAASVLAADLEFEEYIQRAVSARNRGDWQSAANRYAQALNHADLPKDGATRSEINMEYGRSMGVLCQYGEAEKYLLRAKEIATQSSSPLFPVLQELLVLSVVQKKYDAAAAYFAQLQPLIERESRVKSSPLLVANAYEKMAEVLTAGGKVDEAAARRQEALQLRESAPKVVPPGTITPYGAKCPKP